MEESSRLRLLHGPYMAPKVRPGDALAGYEVGGFTDAPIPWPYRKRPGTRSLILTGDLERAVLCESEIAIAHHWGVSVPTVWRWRRELGIGRINEGTERLYRDYHGEKLPDEVAEIGRQRALAPEVIERQRAQKIGKPAHPATREALLRGARKPKSEAWKAALAERNRRRKRRTAPTPEGE